MPVKTLYVIHGWLYHPDTRPDNWDPDLNLKHHIDSWAKLAAVLKDNGVKLKFLKVPGITTKSKHVFTLENYLDWLDEQLSGQTGHYVLGHSNGGRLMLNYCLRQPAKVKHLILLNSAGITPSGLTTLKINLLRKLSQIFKFFKGIRAVRVVGQKLFSSYDHQVAPDNMKLTLRNMLDSDHELNLRRVKSPISLIWGELDAYTPLRNYMIFRRKLPNVVSYEVIESAKHNPYKTHPKALAKAILRALDKAN